MIKITNNFGAVLGSVKQLQSDVDKMASQMAINRTLERGRTEMTRAITDEFDVKAKDVRPQLRITKAARKGGQFVLRGELEAFGVRKGKRSRNVMLFSARPAPGRESKKIKVKTPTGWVTRNVPVGGGVSVKIKKTGGRKIIKGAFIGNKGRTVFMRDPGAARLPISPVETVDVPQMFNMRKINRRVLARMAEVYEIEYQRAMTVALARYSARSA